MNFCKSKLPADKRDGFIEKFRRRTYTSGKNITMMGKPSGRLFLINSNTCSRKCCFVSLPLFALMLRLLYVRRKQFFYVNHIVFSIHLYCGTFIIILAGITEFAGKCVNLGTEWIGFAVYAGRILLLVQIHA
jgi:hypothetical protein